MDTLFSKVKSINGHVCAQVITNGQFTRVYPMMSKASENIAMALREFIDYVGVPDELVCDLATEQVGSYTPVMDIVHRYHIKTHFAEKGRSNMDLGTRAITGRYSSRSTWSPFYEHEFLQWNQDQLESYKTQPQRNDSSSLRLYYNTTSNKICLNAYNNYGMKQTRNGRRSYMKNMNDATLNTSTECWPPRSKHPKQKINRGPPSLVQLYPRKLSGRSPYR
jgi:hypothetical protein